MHELSIVKNLVRTVLSRYSPAENERIVAVKVVMGEMHDYEEEWLTKYFVQVTKDTVLENAALKVERLPVKLRCRACGREFGAAEKDERPFSEREDDSEGRPDEVCCPGCGSCDFEIINGREFYVKELEVETR